MWRKTILTGVILLSLSSATYALDPLGPPKALLGRGHWGLGVEYAHSQADVELTDRVTAGLPLPDESSRLRADKVYVNLRYGAWKQVDVFARLGAVAFDDANHNDPKLQNGDAGFAWGLGVAATLCHMDRLDWGALVQFSRGVSSAYMYPASDYASELEAWSLQVAGGPTYRFRDDLAVYGGLFYQLFRGEFELGTYYESDVEETDRFGGFVGLDWSVKENAHWTVEFQYAGSTLTVATGLRWILN